MRCSICLAELKEGPNGLECAACETVLEPVVNDASMVDLSTKPRGRIVQIGIMIGAALGIILLAWSIYTFEPDQQVALDESAPDTAVIRAEALVSEDENVIVAQALRPVTSGDIVELIKDKGCQPVSEDRIATFQWVNLVGDSMSTSRPSFPGNWRVHQVCPVAQGGAMFATLLDDGVAISKAGQRDEQLWTQLINVGNPRAEAVHLLIDGPSALLIAHDDNAPRIIIESYDVDGKKNWSRSLNAGQAVERLNVAKTGLGDYLIAWREHATELRFSIVSASGILLQDGLIDGVSRPVRDVAQNELGGTLLVLGDDELFLKMISSVGITDWEHSVARVVEPIGVLNNDADFLVFAASSNRLLIWGFDHFGTRSNRLELALAEPILDGEIRQINSAEALLTLSMADEAAADLVLDLRRLRSLLIFEATDIAPMMGPAAQMTFERSDGPITAVLDAEKETDSGRSDEATLSVARMPDADLEPVVELPEAPSVVVETAFPVAEISASTIAADPEPRQDETERISGAAAAVLPPEQGPQDAQARCTFSCISSDEPTNEYVILQTVDLIEDERITDVALRLSDAHVSLCTISGGEPVPEFTRECVSG